MTSPPACRWPRGRVNGLLMAAVLLGTAGPSCTLLTNFDDELQRENTFARCRDRTDNDNDGLTDCDDPSCSLFDYCQELTPGSCADGVDNDGDGLTDCADPGCAALAGVCVEKTASACSDGADNDNDGLIDCKDSDCSTLDVCQEASAADCIDGVDNDRDGLVDCVDFDCHGFTPCCTIPASLFTGDEFNYNASCALHTCTASEPTCCDSGYELCNEFDPALWVPWGLPRARQLAGAFRANEPCGCEPSGVVSVESVHLKPAGLRLKFGLKTSASGAIPNRICAGLTQHAVFTDDIEQCAGTTPPQLLVGICLQCATGKCSLTALADGAVQREVDGAGGGPHSCTISVEHDGVRLQCGGLGHKTTALSTASDRALVVIHGEGTDAELSQLTVLDPGASTRRCRAPTDWYRHLARGEPVVGVSVSRATASHPTVVHRSDTDDYLMLLSGTATSASSWAGVHAAKSGDGVVWDASTTPVFPRSATDATFGAGVDSPCLLRWKGKYHAWYTRTDTVGTASRAFTQRAIAHAVSKDGIDWVPSSGADGGPFVFQPASGLAWDSLSVSAPSVVVAPDGKLLMWYVGKGRGIGARPTIGVASSSDGTTWTRLGSEPVITVDPSSPELGCGDPAVVWDPSQSIYRMWYSSTTFGHDSTIRYAVSPNGLAWTIYSQGPALNSGPLGAFDARGVQEPAVVLSDERVLLWFTGLDAKGTARIGYAENRGLR